MHAEKGVPRKEHDVGCKLVQPLLRPLLRQHEDDRLHVQEGSAHAPAGVEGGALERVGEKANRFTLNPKNQFVCFFSSATLRPTRRLRNRAAHAPVNLHVHSKVRQEKEIKRKTKQRCLNGNQTAKESEQQILLVCETIRIVSHNMGHDGGIEVAWTDVVGLSLARQLAAREPSTPLRILPGEAWNWKLMYVNMQVRYESHS